MWEVHCGRGGGAEGSLAAFSPVRRVVKQWLESADTSRSGDQSSTDRAKPMEVIRRGMLIFPIDNLWWPVSITV
jgi:hypothetical protein